MTHTPEEIELVARALWLESEGEAVTAPHDAVPITVSGRAIQAEMLRTYEAKAAALLDALAALRPTPALDAPVMSDHVTGTAFVFDPGCLYIRKDGSGEIAISEADFSLEDDWDGEGGGFHWISRLDASEVVELRNFLSRTIPEAQRLAPQIGGLAAERMKREAAEVALRHKAKVAVNEELWHEGQDWACQRINAAIIAIPTGYTETQLDAEALARPKVRALMEALKSMRSVFSPFPREDTESWREEHEACQEADAALLDMKGAEHE